MASQAAHPDRLVARMRGVAAAGACALAVAACSTSGKPSAPPDEKQSTAPTDYGQIAVLRAIGGSAVGGKIRVINRGTGATMLVSVYSLPYGPFRIALHEAPNCTSPNGFSAGSPWAPASAGKPAENLVPVQYANPDSSRIEIEVPLPGVRATGPNGVAGHSVVVYSGSRVTAAQPDVGNERIACGVFEPATLLSI